MMHASGAPSRRPLHPDVDPNHDTGHEPTPIPNKACEKKEACRLSAAHASTLWWGASDQRFDCQHPYEEVAALEPGVQPPSYTSLYNCELGRVPPDQSSSWSHQYRSGCAPPEWSHT